LHAWILNPPLRLEREGGGLGKLWLILEKDTEREKE